MSPCVPKFVVGQLLAALMLAMLTSAHAQQPVRRGPPRIEFTEPGSATTNAHAQDLGAKKSSSKLPKDAIRKPFELLELDDSFSGVPAPNVRNSHSGANSKRAQELMERKKNWVFSTPEETYGLPTTEEMLDVPEFEPNGEAKTAKSSLERYLQRMEKARTEVATNHVKGDNVPDWQKSDEEEDRSYARKEEKAEDRSFFGLGQANANRPAPGTDLSSAFGGGPSTVEKNFKDWFNSASGDANPKSAASSAAQSGRMDAFKELLKARSPASAGLDAGYDSAASRSSAESPWQSSFSSVLSGRDSLSPQPAPRPSSLPALAPTTLPNSYSPSYSPSPSFNPLPSVSVPRTFTPAAPAFELPQRKF